MSWPFWIGFITGTLNAVAVGLLISIQLTGVTWIGGCWFCGVERRSKWKRINWVRGEYHLLSVHGWKIWLRPQRHRDV